MFGNKRGISMKIYFAGAIRGGRQDAPLYHKIIKLLKQHGEVLTEHVGHENPDRVESGIPDAEIYERDMSWLEEADVLVAEVTVASHGVGYEIARAEALGKGILCLYRLEDTQRLSALIAGNPNVKIERYECFEDLWPTLEAFLRDHEPDKQT
jgi:nucleoside 2-deoxyribosyltransferase